MDEVEVGDKLMDLSSIIKAAIQAEKKPIEPKAQDFPSKDQFIDRWTDNQSIEVTSEIVHSTNELGDASVIGDAIRKFADEKRQGPMIIGPAINAETEYLDRQRGQEPEDILEAELIAETEILPESSHGGSGSEGADTSDQPSTNPDEPEPFEYADPTGEGNCAHMCSDPNCQEWWSHGPKDKCRYPDLANQGLCPKCLTTDNQTKLLEPHRIPDNRPLDTADFKMEGGKPVMSPRAQVFYRNQELRLVKDMNVEQLTFHIQHYAQMIEELRVRSMQSRSKRAELEEEALQDIPEEEREKFIQALRNGNKKKTKTAKEPKQKKESPKEKERATLAHVQSARPSMSLKEAQVIANYMIKTGSTLEVAEAWLND